MKKKSSLQLEDDLRPEYDLRSLTLIGVGPGRKVSSATRRKIQAARRLKGITLVHLDPDVAANFPTSREVNDVLRAVSDLIKLRKKQMARKTA